MDRKPPNLLLIQADQMKPQVLPGYGGPADAPHLERLGEEGVLFENAYCNFPLCAPSRFSMLAGMLPSRIGAYDNGAEYFAQIPTMAHYLRLAGYHTCLSGKQHFVGPDMLHGFHERLVPELYPTNFSWTPSWSEVRMESNNDAGGVTRAGVCARSVQMDHDEAVLYRANARLHDYARGGGQPFFLAVSFTHPHEPYYCLRRFWDRYRHEDVPMPETGLLPAAERSPHTERMLRHHSLLDGGITEAHVRTARHACLANVSYVDEMVGSLLDTLGLTGLSDDTVVIVTADHGDMHRRARAVVQEALLRPLRARAADRARARALRAGPAERERLAGGSAAHVVRAGGFQRRRAGARAARRREPGAAVPGPRGAALVAGVRGAHLRGGARADVHGP